MEKNMLIADGNNIREATAEEIEKANNNFANFQAQQLAELPNKNKAQAMSLLAQTDWTTMSDVTTGTHKLTNQAEFIAYRDQIRIIAVNPTSNVTWPTMPTEVWSN